MASLLSLPRELRDVIYSEVLNGSTSLKPSPQPRKSLAKRRPTAPGPPANDRNQNGSSIGVAAGGTTSNEADVHVGAHGQPEPDYTAGEAALRYSLAEPIPPTSSVLQACRLLRAEMLDTIRLNKVRYKIRLAFREDTETLHPTWVSLPAFASHIHVLEVEMHTRMKKTPSLFSIETAATDAEFTWRDRDALLGGLVLLRRFLERGPLFIARKKAKKITIETLVLHIEPKDQPSYSPDRIFTSTVENLDDVLLDGPNSEYDDSSGGYRDEFLIFFAERITRFQCRVGEQCKEYLLADVLAQVHRRQERKRLEGEVPIRSSVMTWQENNGLP